MAILKDLLGETTVQVLENLEGMSDKFIALEKIIPAVNDALTDQASELRKLNKELGGGSKTVAKFRYEIASLSKTIGVSIKDFAELTESTKKYHQGIVESTASTLKFSKAVGVMPSTLGEFSAKLTILGHTSETSFDKMYENILAVRGAYGLTSEQIEDILAITTKYTIATQASDDQIIQATLSLSKFTSQLTSAGIEASKVTDLLNSMLDPDKLTDNLVLMSKMGITVSDMISGDPTTKLEGATERLKELGQEITNIAANNRLQANEMAKVYNLTLEDAKMLAELDTSDKAINTQKKLDQYRGEMATFTESIKSFTSSVGASLSKPLSFLGNIIQTFTDTLNVLPKGLIALIGGVALKKIFVWVSGKLGEAAKSFGNKLTEPLKDYLGQVGDKFAAKERDAATLSPKKGKETKIDYGIGLNYSLEAQKRRSEFNKKRLGPGMSAMTTGEKIENVQAMNKRIMDLEKYRNSLKLKAENKDADAIKELSMFEQTYGNQIEVFKENFGEMITKIQETNKNWKDDRVTALKGYDDLKDKAKISGFATLNANLREQKIDTSKLGIGDGTGKNDKAIAEIASTSEGPREFMEKLIEFYRLSDDPKSTEYLQQAEIQYAALNDNMAKGVGITENYKKGIEAVNKAENEGKKGIGFRNRTRALGEGLKTNFGTLIKKIFSPKKLMLGLGLGIILPIIKKIGSALIKSEGIQEKLAAAGEQVTEWINNISEAIGPAVSGILDFVSSFFGLIKPYIERFTNFLGGISKSVGNGLSKTAKSISNSVSTIEDSYKKEDLRTMVGATGQYNAKDDNIEIIGLLKNISSGMNNISKNQQIAADASILQ